MSKRDFDNLLLRWLPDEAFALVEPHLVRVPIKVRESVIRSNHPVLHVWFPAHSQFSVLCKVAQSEPIEVGMIGWEGMTPLPVEGRLQFENICQVAGDAYRVEAAILRDLILSHQDFTKLYMRYGAYAHSQTCFTALSHGSFTVEKRLARWLLMVDDRLECGPISLAQEFFSWMLAVRRAGVSEAIKALRDSGCIETTRGEVRIIDRAGLIELASGSYGPAEDEYERLLGRRISRRG